MKADDARHGTREGYQRGGCREACCRRPQMVAIKRWRMGATDSLIDATGTRRRIQALMAIGYSHAELGRTLGRSRNYTHELMTPDIRVVESTAATIAELFDRLCMVPAMGRYSTRTRNLAARSGYAPPLAWDDIDNDPEPPTADQDDDIDPVVVMRLLEGRRIQATKAEKEAAVRRWVMDGGTERELCEIHGWKAGRYTAGLRLVRGGAA